MATEITVCAEEDLGSLRGIAIETYEDTFGPQNEAETMASYLREAMGQARLLGELRRPGSFFYFIHEEGRLAGYLKLNVDEAQTGGGDPDSLEIERIYVRKAFKGRGLGKALMDHAAGQAKARGKKTLRLGVWERNFPAQAFYESLGFRKVGSHPFRMGEEIQTDYVMEKTLA